MGIQIKDILAVMPDMSTQRTNVCIEGDSILSLGDIPQEFHAETTIDGAGKLLTPGFINAHTHAYMTPFRNWADDLDFSTWLFDRIMPAEDKMTEIGAYWGAMLSCMEMIKSGTTCFLDMHMHPTSSVKAALDSGMRAVISRGLSGGMDDVDGGARRLAEALSEYDACHKFPTIGFMLAPHAPYSCDEAYLCDISAYAKEMGLGIHTHLSESRSEVENCREKYGVSPIGLFDRCGLLNEKTVAAHCVHLSDEDIELLAARRVNVAVNTGSNLKLGNGVARVPDMMKAGINLCLGTDGASSNNSLNMLREMQLVSLIHKGVREDPLAVTARDAFAMATSGGARALGLEGKTGAVAEGMLADLAIFSLDTPALCPLGDPIAALCYSSAGVNADTVIVNGKIVLKNGEFTRMDMQRVKFNVERCCKLIGTMEDDENV